MYRFKIDMNDSKRDDDENDENNYLYKIRQILIQTKIEPAKSKTMTELFRRYFFPNTIAEQYEGIDCEQGGYHEIVPRLFLGD